MKLIDLYRQMSRARELELAVGVLWSHGLITGEMHAGTGEEAVAAGVVAHLTADDSLALTHRCSPFVVARGVPLVPVIRELMGREDGLCHGQGGHMHLFSREHRLATSGIVGASLPMAAGFAMAAKKLRPDAVAVAQTGDGAMNQGMALETLNLAAVWKLPLLVACIDNGWAIATPAGSATAGDLEERARAFGWAVEGVDGTDVAAVHEAAGKLLERLRRGKEPAFLHATAPRMQGHYLGDKLVRLAREPFGHERATMGMVAGAAVASHGGGLLSRATGVAKIMNVLHKARAVPEPESRKDPIVLTRKQLQKIGYDHRLIEAEARAEIHRAVETAMEGEHA